MPSYNHEKYIAQAIESVLNQTFPDFELIIIDDGSKDRSKEIIKAYEKKDKRIRAIFHKNNKGIARTMNEGLRKAKGKFIALFSSDDVWVKDKLEKQLKFFEKNDDLVVWSEGLVIDAQGNPTGGTFTQMYGASKKKKSGNLFEELLKGNYIFGQSVILKKKNIKDITYDERLKYLNDYKFMVDLAYNYEFYYIPEPLAMYRIHGKNSILSDRREWLRDQILVSTYFLERYGDRISKKLRAMLYHRIASAYAQLGERKIVLSYLPVLVKIDPISLYPLILLGLVATSENSLGRKILRKVYYLLLYNI
ncbi:Glycosyl transferase, family 2 [Thermococcus sibiricus MM 739]|uniref:Glycosyl transferase, family 2 n=2 Tax=Thermococcus sibiricus TaxID=172049 RepID=C6A0B6_THESM|nr:Glycosyl transferase, family 2 [Thermococcus sibiricus MM 739]